MKQVILTAMVLVAALFLLPLAIIRGEPLSALPDVLEGESWLIPSQPAADTADSQITIQVQMGDEIVPMALDEYLWGVVAAEMPASFEEEALKAQAVAARTFTLYRAAHRPANHPDADVCTDVSCCAAYRSREEAMAAWGDQGEIYAQRIADAVSATDGLVIRYDGELIQAVFHSSSASTTRDAAEVWGNAVPYLVPVESPEGEEVPNYYTTVTLTAEEFRRQFLEAWPGADLSGEPESWFQSQSYTSEGNLHAMTIGGVEVSAAALRSLLGLRSPSFTVTPEGDEITFYVTGYGHGVGMSQYGANALAKEGLSFTEILEWYYTGVSVEPYGI